MLNNRVLIAKGEKFSNIDILKEKAVFYFYSEIDEDSVNR